MKKFSGPAKKKKACKLRICSQSSIVKSTESPINEVDVTIKKLNAVVDKFRHQTPHVHVQPVLSEEEVLKGIGEGKLLIPPV